VAAGVQAIQAQISIFDANYGKHLSNQPAKIRASTNNWHGYHCHCQLERWPIAEAMY
jgi:hypothetical protein